MAQLRTHIFEGAARALSIPLEAPVMGGRLRAATVSIDTVISYRQWSDWCTLHVTLERSFTPEGAMRPRKPHPADRRGAVSFLPDNVEHTGTACCGIVAGVEISLDPRVIGELCEHDRKFAWRTSRDVQDVRTFLIAEALVREMQNAEEPLVSETMMATLARHVGRRHGGAQSRYDDAWLHPAALRRVVERIRSAPADPPRLAELAGLAGLGVSAFLRGFRGSVGVTPAAFSKRVRIEQARRIIEARDLPLSEVASMTGFASASHLVSSFRSQLGSTPARWRQSVRNVTKSA